MIRGAGGASHLWARYFVRPNGYLDSGFLVSRVLDNSQKNIQVKYTSPRDQQDNRTPEDPQSLRLVSQGLAGENFVEV